MVRAERPERPDEIDHRLGHAHPGVRGVGRGNSTALLQLTGRDAEGRTPDPAVGSLDFVAAAERLCEGLGHRVARELLVAAEGHERPPQPRAVVPPHAFDGIAGIGHGDIVNPHTPQGTIEPESCRSIAHDHGFRSETRMIGLDHLLKRLKLP